MLLQYCPLQSPLVESCTPNPCEKASALRGGGLFSVMCLLEGNAQLLSNALQLDCRVQMDHLMYITMMFWYFILPVLEVGLLQGECVSPLMFARGAAVAVPSLLSIFCEDR